MIPVLPSGILCLEPPCLESGQARRMRRVSVVFGLLGGFLFSPNVCSGQTPAAKPEFDAASVRVNHSGANGPETVVITNPRGNGTPIEVLIYANGDVSRETALAPGGAVTLRFVTLRQLITQAYLKEISRDEYLTGGPSWLDADRFDLIAKAPPSTSIDTERLMIQTVLAARFHLALHREQKPMPVYALTIGKRGLKLQAAGSGARGCKGRGRRRLHKHDDN
jgi:uncharacterized protein (TIGR03435 family)